MRRSFLLPLIMALAALACTSNTQPPLLSVPQVLYSGDASTTFRVFGVPLSSTATASVTLTGFGLADDAVTDRAGHVFLLDNGPIPPVIDEYARPLTSSSVAIAKISVTGKSTCAYLALDLGGNLWVSCFGGGVVKINGPFTATGAYSGTIGAALAGIGDAQQLAFDAAGDLFVADSGNHAVDIFQAPVSDGHTPSGTLAGSEPTAVAVDASGNVYDADFPDNSLRRWNAPVPLTSPGVAANIIDPSTNTQFFGPRSLSFDASGNLYAGNCNIGIAGSIDVFSIPANGFTSSSAPAVINNMTDCVWGVTAGPP